MANVLLVVLLIITIILIGLILIQRSEGGALGIGGGGGGFMSGRSTTDMIQKLTAIMGGLFLLTCLAISIAFNYQNRNQGPFDASGAQKELVQDGDAKITNDMKKDGAKANKVLNPVSDSAKDDTPLEDDSKRSEKAPESEATPLKGDQKADQKTDPKAGTDQKTDNEKPKDE